jgi:hypothetical protein
MTASVEQKGLVETPDDKKTRPREDRTAGLS